MDISITIPAYNEAASIGALLESVCSDDYGRHRLLQVIVCDDASTDDTAAVIEDLALRFPHIIVLRNAGRSGCAHTIARTLERAKGDAVVRINADVAVEKGAIALLADALDDGAAVAVGANVPVFGRATPAALASCFSFEVVARLKAGPHRQHYAVGHFVAYRRDMLRGLAFPRDLINDDHYIAAHVTRAGGRVVNVPQARCRLKPPATAQDYWRVSRRVLEGERQLRRRYGIGSAPLSAVLAAVALTAVRKPLHGLVWAGMYAWSSGRATPAHDGAYPIARSTKGSLD